jgi:hypothetical protein
MAEHVETGAARARLDALQGFLARVAAQRGGSTASLDAAAAEVLAALDEAGVDALLLKGRGLAMLLYGPGDHRWFTDVDVLVAPGKVAAAEDTLASLGYRQTAADDGIDDIGGVVHADTWMRTVSRSGADPPIDLHRWLPGARVEPGVAWEALLARRTWIELSGRRAGVLDRSGQAMHLATHAAQHGLAIEKHVDELDLALALWPTEVWDSAALLAREIGATEAFAAGLRLCRRGGEMARRLELPATDLLDWTIRHRGERPRGTFHLQALAEAKSLRDVLDVVRRSLLPRRAWIIHEHPWARPGGLRVLAAYAVHLAKTPVWAIRAWRFRRRGARGGGLP